MKVAIFGTGYVRLVAGACLDDAGHSVNCIDIDKSRVRSLKAGRVLMELLSAAGCTVQAYDSAIGRGEP